MRKSICLLHYWYQSLTKLIAWSHSLSQITWALLRNKLSPSPPLSILMAFCGVIKRSFTCFHNIYLPYRVSNRGREGRFGHTI
jgi:hypothetical protein